MAECEPKDRRPGDCNVGEDDADHVGGDDHVASRTRQKKSRESMVTQKPTGRDIDDMKIIDLKSALRQLKLSTTGNKSELKVRLREARGRKRSMAMAADCDDGAATACEDDATNNEETTDESASDDDSDDQTETEQNDEKNRKKRDEKKNVRRSEVMQSRRRTRARDRTGRGECSDDDESSNSNDTDYEEEDRRRNRRATRNAHRRDEYSQPGFTIRDVEDSLTHFSGDDKLPIDKWIAEFEDMGDMLRWNELQMLIYGRRMLKGSAKQFVSFEKGITSWSVLKRRLKREFTVRVSSAAVHSQLYRRKRQPNESGRQYLYAMQEIASQGRVEEDAIIQYTIDGIQDDDANKMILYSARTIRELKEKLEVYDRIKEKGQRKKTMTKKDSPKPTVGSTKNSQVKSHSRQPDRKHCFHCGSKGHEIKSCPDTDKGPKCFKCNDFGHIASKCPQAQPSGPAAVNWVNSTDGRSVVVNIGGHQCAALVDTGSDVSLIRSDLHQRIGQPEINSTARIFKGLGNVMTKPIGSCRVPISVGGVAYEIELFIVPGDAMNSELLIGNDFLKNTEVIIRGGRVTMRPLLQESDRPIKGQEPSTKNGDSTDDTGYEELVRVNCIATEEIGVEEPYRREIKKLIAEHRPKDTVDTKIETKIILKDDIPVSLPPRRLAPKEKAVLDKQISEWLESGIVKPSCSEYASPVVLTRKKDGSYRVCIDYRQLNKKIVRDKYPMPIIDERIDALVNFRVFSVIDLKNGFFHVPVSRESRKFTAFVTPNGQYEFIKTPFGLCNSPASFLRFVDEVFRDLIRRSVVFTYMDDLIIPGRDKEDAFVKLKETLSVAADHGLNINWKKCEFLQRSVEFLGHVIEDGSVRPSPAKAKAVQGFPQPKTSKQLQSFLGLTSYFRKFIKDYSRIAYPLYEIKEGRHFHFGPVQQLAFVRLKEVLSKEPVLRIYDPTAMTEVHTDASKEGYGAALLQRRPDEKYFHPVYYMSCKTTDAERKWCAYELEVLAVVKAVTKFRVYLLGIRFKIVTDCQAFQGTLKKEKLSPKVARWAMTLEEFDYDVEHRAGERMKHVDALSRYPIMIVEDTMLEVIKREQDQEERLRVIKQLLVKEPYEDYIVENGILTKRLGDKNVVVLPSSMHREVISRVHDNGHFSSAKMIDAIQEDYYIPQLKAKIDSFIQCCIPCVLAEKKKGKKEGELRPIPKGDCPLSTYHLDHLGPMTNTSKLYRYLLVIVDGFSKFVWIYPTKTTNTTEVLDKMNKLQQIFGNPQRVITDKGTVFTSSGFRDYCVEQGIEHITTTTGVPRGNGQVERINRIIIPVLTKLSLGNPSRWYQHVARLQMNINSTYQRSIGMSPFEALLGVRMRHRNDVQILSLLEQEYVQLFDDERDNLRQIAKRNILKVQLENQRSYNKRCKSATEYREGDLVVIKRTQFAPGLKIKQKYLGPYKISQVKGSDRYEVIKVAKGEGPEITTSAADHMKFYRTGPSEAEG